MHHMRERRGKERTNCLHVKSTVASDRWFMGGPMRPGFPTVQAIIGTMTEIYRADFKLSWTRRIPSMLRSLQGILQG